MTELLHKEFSRKAFVKGGGAMVVGLSMLGAGAAAKSARAAEDPYASMGPYDARRLDTWLAVHADNTVTLKAGKVELGQGTLTGLMMIAAEELDVGLAQMKYAKHDTNVTANQGPTVGSYGIQTGGMQVRAAAAAARSALLDLAATQLGVAKASLTVSNGVVSGGGRSVTYGALIGDKLFNVTAPDLYRLAPNPAGVLGGTGGVGLAAGDPSTKQISQYKLVGHHGIPRVDIPAKVNGGFTYVHNIKVPGMLHGRLVRPRGQGAYGDGTAPKVISVDESSIKSIDAKVVRYGNFVGVVAEREYNAIQAAAQLKVTYADPPALPSTGNLWKQMREHDSAGQAPARIAINTGNFDAAYAAAPIKLSQTYKFHYNGHLPIGPSCCVAQVTPQGARIFTNTQDAYSTRQQVKTVLDQVMGSQTLPLDRIRVSYYEGSSTYGSAPYNDGVQAAAIMSALAGKPVRLQFMRWDEHGWDNYGPAQMTDIRAGVDASGNLTAFEFTALGIPYWSTPPSQHQVSGSAVFATVGPLDTTISGSQYNVPNRRVIGKSLPLENNYLKVSFLRSPNAPQSVFAAEQMIDELAHAAKLDPVAFRLKNIATTATDAPQRWRNVLTNVAELSKWTPKVAASNLSSANVVTGRGVAFGHFSNTMSAAVVDVEVNRKTGKVVAKRVYCCTDPGYVVYPDGLDNNELGAVVQGLSFALSEQVVFNQKNVTSLDWVTYPILRFNDAPKVTVKALSRTDVPNPTGPGARSTGGGEPGTPPVAGALANAFFDATGVRIREAPLTPGRVRAVLRAAGKLA
jgi:CO/xanthine dehydrogenase Mo-binding subunit